MLSLVWNILLPRFVSSKCSVLCRDICLHVMLKTMISFGAIPKATSFSSAGKFLQCRKEAKWKHWFHLKCFNSDRTGEPLCPHCGEKSEQHEVVLRLKALEASVAERILGESGDRVVQEVGVAATTTSSSNAEAASSSSSANQLVPTANPPQRAKMTFEKYLKSGTKSTASSSNGFLTKCEEKSYSKFDIDASLVVNVKKSDGTEFKFRHMPLGLPADIMVSLFTVSVCLSIFSYSE